MRARREIGPRSLRWRAGCLSVPAAGKFLACCIARETSTAVKGGKVDGGSELMAFVSCQTNFIWMRRVDGGEFGV